MLETPEAKSAILVHLNTGKILYQKDMHKRLAPASMTKIMTLLLLIERVNQGAINLSDIVTISERAARAGGNRFELKTGERVRVEELLKMVAIPSYNDAATAVAELVAGTYEDFLDMMNAKARELGLKNTNFRSAHGLMGVSKHFSSAYDMAKLSRALIETGLIFNYCSLKECTLTVENGTQKITANTNTLIDVYPGLDGLKTGYLYGHGYNLSATMTIGEHRFIAVSMNAASRKASADVVVKMFDYARSLPEFKA